MRIRPQTSLLAALFASCVLAVTLSRAQQADPAQKAADQSSNRVQAESPEPGTATTAADTSNEERRWRGRDWGPLVTFGHDVVVKSNETAEAVVVIGGSARVDGKVREAVVTIWGNVEINGEARDTVAVMGGIKAGPDAMIHDNAVAVGGRVDAADSAKLGQQPVSVEFPRWLLSWFNHCFLMMRPLAPQVGWVWVVAGVFVLLYLLIAAVFPKPVAVCVEQMTNRPAMTFLMGLVAKLLVPVITIILIATGVGIVVLPFIGAALFLCALIGKVAFLQWLGFSLGRHFGSEGLRNPLLAFVLGTLIITLLYLVPVLGLVTYSITSVWGLGTAVMAGFGSLRREMPERNAPSGPSMPLPMTGFAGPAQPAVFGDAGNPPGGIAGTNPVSGVSAPFMAPTQPGEPPVLPDALSFPRAGFWERMGAGFLDLVLVGILGVMVHVPPLAFLIALCYFTGMWGWKGTTVGGIVLGLKVVRLDGQPVTFPVALVRALAAAFSMVVLFLGFLWIAWDNDKQGWHDKIAGTVVLRQPRGTPLVCL